MIELRNEEGEVVVHLADGWSLRSGVYDKDLTSGEYVRLCFPDGSEYAYWDQAEWRDDPALVMGAIINSAAGLRFAPDIVKGPIYLGDCRWLFIDEYSHEHTVEGPDEESAWIELKAGNTGK